MSAKQFFGAEVALACLAAVALGYLYGLIGAMAPFWIVIVVNLIGTLITAMTGWAPWRD